MRLPFDPEDPPVPPPPGCADPLLWHVARALLAAHQPDEDGWCGCRDLFPCRGHRLAVRGMMRACLPHRNHRWGELPPIKE